VDALRRIEIIIGFLLFLIPFLNTEFRHLVVGSMRKFRERVTPKYAKRLGVTKDQYEKSLWEFNMQNFRDVSLVFFVVIWFIFDVSLVVAAWVDVSGPLVQWYEWAELVSADDDRSALGAMFDQACALGCCGWWTIFIAMSAIRTAD
tara:strand:+ start:361 stop:801 length:441 start_codon:yes stop_codon:yes gene_type:complete